MDLVLVELARSELACACLALVRLKVARMEPPSSAGSAHQLRSDIRVSVVPAFIVRPVLSLVSFITTAASKLRLTGHAHQAALPSPLLISLGVVQHRRVEHVAAELAQAFLALVLSVLSRRGSSLCAKGAHEVSVAALMVMQQGRAP